MLARTLEDAGLSTILVTMMPYWAEKIGTPRTLAVEFPFAHTLGQPHNREQQSRVIRQALETLQNSREAGQVNHSPETWPEPTKEAIKNWQPEQPSPIISVLGPQIREILRQRRAQQRGS